MTFEQYAAIEAVNWSTLKELQKSPLAYKHRLTTQLADRDAFRLGRATHTAVLEPHKFEHEYVLWTGGRRAGKAWDEFEETAARSGKTVLTAAQHEQALAIRDAVRGHHIAGRYLEHGVAEFVIQWDHEQTGIPLKGRVDWIHGSGAMKTLVDLKTSRSATDLRMFSASAWRLGYYHQLAFYRAIMRGWSGEDLPCIIIAVEPTAPHDVAVYRLSEDALWAAGQDVDELLNKLAACRALDQWPGACEAEIELDAPAWTMTDDDLDTAEPAWAAGA